MLRNNERNEGEKKTQEGRMWFDDFDTTQVTNKQSIGDLRACPELGLSRKSSSHRVTTPPVTSNIALAVRSSPEISTTLSL